MSQRNFESLGDFVVFKRLEQGELSPEGCKEMQRTDMWNVKLSFTSVCVPVQDDPCNCFCSQFYLAKACKSNHDHLPDENCLPQIPLVKRHLPY